MIEYRVGGVAKTRTSRARSRRFEPCIRPVVLSFLGGFMFKFKCRFKGLADATALK